MFSFKRHLIFFHAPRFTYCLYRCQYLSDDSCLQGQTHDSSNSDALSMMWKWRKKVGLTFFLSSNLLNDRYQLDVNVYGEEYIQINSFVGLSRWQNPVKPVQKSHLMARQLSFVVVMKLAERAAWWHRLVMAHNAPYKKSTSGTGLSPSLSAYVLLYFAVKPQTQVCSFLFIRHSIWENTDSPWCWKTSTVNDVNDALTHTHRGIRTYLIFLFSSLYLHFWKKKKNPQSLTEYFGTVVTTEILNWNNCHTRCCEFISQHKEKWFLASIFTWQDAHCIWTNILHFNYFFVPWNDRNNVSASVKVLSNRAHFSLTKKHGLCKYKTKEREREGVDSCLMENIQRTDIQFHGVEIGALTRFLFHC